MRWSGHAWVRIAAVGLALAVGGGCTGMWFEGQLIYFPSRYPEGRWDVTRIPPPPRGNLPQIEDVFFEASDGEKLHGWYCTPLERGSGTVVPTDYVLLWFHGNAGNLSDRYEMVTGLLNLPTRVFIIDYRGYGRSEGVPSEKGLYRDAEGAWRYLTETRGETPDGIVLFGKSLGGAPATFLATKVEPAGLILQSTFTSVPDMAKRLLPFIPKFLVSTQMNNLKRIREVEAPKLFIHSPADEIVPYDMGRALFAAALEPKRFHEVPGAPHNETAWRGGEAYRQALREFLNSLKGREVGDRP